MFVSDSNLSTNHPLSSPKNISGNGDKCSTVVSEFIARWRGKDGGERSNYQLFISEPCDIHEVLRTYGWPADLSDEEILTLLVALSHARAEVEKTATSAGSVRSIEFPQSPPPHTELAGTKNFKPTAMTKQRSTTQPWPKDLANQIRAVRSALEDHSTPANATPSPTLQKRPLRSHRTYPRKPPGPRACA